MGELQKISDWIFDSDKRFLSLAYRGFYNHLSDEEFIKRKFKAIFGYPLDLNSPKTFNEKLQWLKLYDRKPLYTKMVDKYESKKIIADKLGEEYVIPTLGIWNNFSDIDFSQLPNSFVLKTTHDSGGVVIIKDKSKMDLNRVKSKINKSLKNNYYYVGREWPYKNVKPRIIAEKYLEDRYTQSLYDYNFFCFNGMAKCFKVDFDRFINHHANSYDQDSNLLDFGEVKYTPINTNKIRLSHDNIKKMELMSRKLSENVPLLRCDFYDENGRIYFGELTFYPASGFGGVTSKEADLLLGSWLKLPGGSEEKIVYWDKNIFIALKKKDMRIKDYKFQCFNGKVDNVLVCTDRNYQGAHYYYFDTDWNYLPYSLKTKEDFNDYDFLKPHNLNKMISIAESLSFGFPELRVDLYEVKRKIYFGEFTFFSNNGFDTTITRNADINMGKKLTLPFK